MPSRDIGAGWVTDFGFTTLDNMRLQHFGRHRVGTSPVRVEPRRWDAAKRAAAAQLDQFEPGWFISYGVGSRHFHAIALWQSREALCVKATTIEELRELMREAELEAMVPSGLRRRAT